MNNPRSHRSIWPQMLSSAAFALACISPLMLIGCGDSEPDESTVVVDPPDPNTKPTESSASGAPGSLVLPDGGIPDSDDESPSVGEGGFEMPTDAKPPSSDSDQSNSDATSDPTVLYASWDSIEKEIQNSGKVTVVDFWSLACEPCLKEFPGLVELNRVHGDRVNCVAVDIDYDGRKSRPPNYYEENILAFLKSVQADGVTTYISETPSDDVYAATELVSIPAVMVFDSTGKLVKSFVDAGLDSGFTYEKDVAPFVQTLVSK